MSPQQQREEENFVIERMEKAHQRRQATFVALLGEFLPRGKGVLTQTSLDEHAAAQAEFMAARAEMDRIANEIRSGKRR